MSVVTKIVRLCDVCAHAGTDTFDAQALTITVNRGVEQSIDLCEACTEAYVLPLLTMFQTLGSVTGADTGNGGTKRAVAKRTSTKSRAVPELETRLHSSPSETKFVCIEPGCEFVTLVLKGFIAHTKNKHKYNWDQIARAAGTTGGNFICPECKMGYATRVNVDIHVRARHPETVQ